MEENLARRMYPPLTSQMMQVAAALERVLASYYASAVGG